MSAPTANADFDPAAWSRKDFTERVRIGTNTYVVRYYAGHWAWNAKRGVLEEGYARFSDLAKRKPWDYGEI